MNLLKNKMNSLLVGGFAVYWLFVVLMQIVSLPRMVQVKESFAGQLIFPLTYKMYTSPPKEIIQSFYTYYDKGVPIKRLDVDSLYHARIRNGFPNLTVKRDVKQYTKLYYTPNFDFSKLLYKYTLDSIVNSEKTFQEYLESNNYYWNYVENQLNFSKALQKKDPDIQNADSVVLTIKCRYNLVEMDPDTRYNFAYSIPDTILFKKGKKL